MTKLVVAVLIATQAGCALTARTVGSHDAVVDVARANADAERYRTQATNELLKALLEALAKLAPPTQLEKTMAGPPLALCVDSDGVTVRICDGGRK
jgi:hypothetical protein